MTLLRIKSPAVFLSALLSLLVTMTAYSQSKPVLRFHDDGTFKIVQLTDIHLSIKGEKSDSAMHLIRRIIAEEKPDLVIVTGDVVCSSETRATWMKVTKPFIESGTPWAVVFGNHDDEFELSRQEIVSIIKEMPYCLTVNGPDDISGHGNYLLNIRSADNGKDAAVIYCFDSRSYSTIKDVEGYGWISLSQVEWYRQQSDLITHSNNNMPLPALAFFHIPLPEYREIRSKSNTFGDNNEEPCSPRLNTGLFASMKEKSDVMGVFTGHDHVNNYIGCLYNICLGYGCKTGFDNYGYLVKGARVIVLYEGQRKFDTWIRGLDPAPRFKVTYPDSFAVAN